MQKIEIIPIKEARERLRANQAFARRITEEDMNHAIDTINKGIAESIEDNVTIFWNVFARADKNILYVRALRDSITKKLKKAGYSVDEDDNAKNPHSVISWKE